MLIPGRVGKIRVSDEEYSVNREFQEIVLQLADEVDLDEVEAAKLLLESEDDRVTLSRPLVECGLIRFHQQRKYLLDCMRLCINIAGNDDLPEDIQDGLAEFVSRNVFLASVPGQPARAAKDRFVPRCMAAMQEIRQWLQKLADRVTAASVGYQGNWTSNVEYREALEFSRLSLIQQHENLAVVLFTAIDQRHAEVNDFKNLLELLKKADRYDHLLSKPRECSRLCREKCGC